MADVRTFFGTLTEVEKQELCILAYEWRAARALELARGINLTREEIDMAMQPSGSIQAIRHLQARLGCDLLVAKYVVDRYRVDRP